MSTLRDALQGLREALVTHERLNELLKRVDRMETTQAQHADRLARVETFIDLVRPAITRRALPPQVNP